VKDRIAAIGLPKTEYHAIVEETKQLHVKAL